MKKNFFVFLITLVIIGFNLVSTIALAATLETKTIMMEERLEIIKTKLNSSKKLSEEKINLIITKKKDVIEEKKAIQKKVEDEKQAENTNNTMTEEPVQEEFYTEQDVVTSASQSGREIGEKNREYGRQLSNPNLSQSERQQIIQEKKNYNRGRNR